MLEPLLTAPQRAPALGAAARPRPHLSAGLGRRRTEPLAGLELEPLDPDVVILYAGYNNSILMADRSEANLAFKIKDWLAWHSVAWKTVHHLVRNAYYRVAEALNRDVAGLANLSVPIVLDEETLSARRERSRGRASGRAASPSNTR